MIYSFHAATSSHIFALNRWIFLIHEEISKLSIFNYKFFGRNSIHLNASDTKRLGFEYLHSTNSLALWYLQTFRFDLLPKNRVISFDLTFILYLCKKKSFLSSLAKHWCHCKRSRKPWAGLQVIIPSAHSEKGKVLQKCPIGTFSGSIPICLQEISEVASFYGLV